jgi:hypothetical protein
MAQGEKIMRPISTIAVALLLVSGFAVSAQDAKKPAVQVAAPLGAMAREKAAHGAKVFFVSPRNGAHVGQDVLVKFGVKGMQVLLQPNH